MRWIATGAAAFILGIVAVHGLMGLLVRARLRQEIRSDGPESHQKKSGTLTMGGIGIFAAATAAALAFGGWGSQRAQVALGAAGASFLIGFADDFAKFRGKKTEGIKARYRFLVEVAIGLLVGLYVWRELPGAGQLWTPRGLPMIDIGCYIVPFAAFVFVGTLNAVNFTDGLDGLLSGCALTTLAAFGIFLWRFGDHGLLPVVSSLGGALAAFLWFNAHPAKIFMGDTGSLFIGGIIAATAILSHSALFLCVVGFVYVAEMMSVILQVASFRLTKKRIFRMSPIHHHFELAGWAETQVVTRFWIVSALFAAAGVWVFFR